MVTLHRSPKSPPVSHKVTLGPLLFSIYIDQLCSILHSTTSKIQLYTDDILLHKPIGKDCTLDVANFQRDIDSVAASINLSGLRLNTQNTKFLLVSRLRHPPPIELRVNGTIISRVPSCRDLLGSFYFQWPLLGSPHWLRMLQSQMADWTAAEALLCWKSILQSPNLQVTSFTHSWLLLFPLGPQLCYSCQQAGISSKICSPICHLEMEWQLWLSAEPS